MMNVLHLRVYAAWHTGKVLDRKNARNDTHLRRPWFFYLFVYESSFVGFTGTSRLPQTNINDCGGRTFFVHTKAEH